MPREVKQPSTLDGIERLEQELDSAEREALCNLAKHLREAVLELPSESRLARSFVRHASKFETWARGSAAALWGDVELDVGARQRPRAMGRRRTGQPYARP